MAAKRPELLIVTGELNGKRFAVGERGLRLGRSSSNDIHVPDEELSRNHCFFERAGESGLRVTDLASANGTFVNGQQLEGTIDLKPGDVIEVGATCLHVVGEGQAPQRSAAPGNVDLGFGPAPDTAVPPGGAPAKRRSLRANVLWAVVAVCVAGATALVLFGPKPEAEPIRVPEPVPAAPTIREMSYEKIEANSQSIFRYHMTYASDGMLAVKIDDAGGENRHIAKNAVLDAAGKSRLAEILTDPELRTLDQDYTGPETEPPSLTSWTLHVVHGSRIQHVSVVNTDEPEAFKRIRERLETFTKNELGVWAIQYSRDKLIELAAASAELAQSKWNERDVEHGNVAAAIAAWREAAFYLETINPKPDVYASYVSARETAEKEQDERYREQRFKADRAINLADWETAVRELQVLCQIVPDRKDARHREAKAKLVDAEKRVQKGVN